MTSPLRSPIMAIAPILISMFAACDSDPTPADERVERAQLEMSADSSTLLSQQKMYLSFEVRLEGERVWGGVPTDALTDSAWRVSRSVIGEMVLDTPLPGSVPPSIASDASLEVTEEGRYIGWMAAPPDDPAFIEKMMTGELDVANNPMFVPVEFRIDDEVHNRGRDFPSQPLTTTNDMTIKGRGKAYISNSAIVSCDLKLNICDISGLLGGGYTDSTDLVTIAETSSYPGEQGKSRTMGPGLLLPQFDGTLDNRLAGIKFQLSGPITTSFSGPYHETYLGLGADAALVVTFNVTVSPRPAPDTRKPQ